MNINQLFQYAIAGKKLRHIHWEKHKYVYLKDNKFYCDADKEFQESFLNLQ